MLGLMLLTNAQAVASVLRGTAGSEAYPALAALVATKTLAVVTEDTMHSLVGQARAEGSTWQEIGTVLGTTRQAAYQRFGSPNPEETVMETSLPDADVRALDVFSRCAEGDWSITSQFDDNMRERLPEDLLSSTWSQVTASVGGLDRLGEPVVRSVQGHIVVDVPLSFERGEMKGRVAYSAEGQIAGLFILNPDVD